MTEQKVPSCFGSFVCLDDCVVSCPFWEECKELSEDDGEEDHGMEVF